MATLKGETIKEYLKEWINLPSHSLSRKIYAENKELYKDEEHVRSLIRYYRGASGAKLRETLKDIEFASEWNKYELPNSEAEDYDDYILDGERKILLFSDVHVPYHDVEALSVMFDYADDREFTDIFINGDFWDFHHLSYFQKDPRKRHLKYELDVGRSFFEKLRKIFPTQRIYLKLGNHEERWENYLKDKSPELLDTSLFNLEDVFPFLDLGIEVINDKRIVKAGHLNILHGHELKMKGVTVNPARTAFLKTYASTIVGHLHRSSEHTERDLSGDVVTCWSVGCMCWMHPHYAPINKWNHGFASIRVDNNGYFNVKNRRIINGEVR